MFFAAAALLPFLVHASTPGPAADGRAWDGRTRTLHEWGTFVSVQGSDGIALDGLRHHDRDLPPFVHDLAKRGGILALQLKMETPVVYFYAPGTWRLDLDVRFPHGLVTQWWPTAQRVNEPCARGAEVLAEHCARVANLKDGFVSWGRHDDLVILPPDAEVELAPVAADDPWGFARAVASNPLRVARAVEEEGKPTRYELEHERLLFYRGLGDFALPLAVRVRTEERRVDERAGAVRRLGLDLTLARDSAALRGLFVIDVEGDLACFARLGDLAASRAEDLELALRPKADATAELAQAVAAELEHAGLFADEARAMARTWEHAWFGDEGLRVLYVLPSSLVERELPLTVSHGVHQAAGANAWDEAPPESIVRVFVARTEVLTPSKERVLRDTVKQRADGDAKAAEAIAAWGRFAEPWLARVRALEPDPTVRAAAEALLREARARP
ncbi:MAG: hypothetical protein HZA53_04755 [Planctomycetes bacterium]|nr:hypothetical protein [Planctomycetota bacterium]